MATATIVVPPVGGAPTLIYTWPLDMPGNAFPSTEATVLTSDGMGNQQTYGDISGGTVGPAVTITVPASGKVRLTMNCWIDNQGGAGGGLYMSWAASGANTISPTDANGLFVWANGGGGVGSSGYSGSRSLLLTGLTPGSTTFTAKYRANWASNASFNDYARRRLLIEPVDADN